VSASPVKIGNGKNDIADYCDADNGASVTPRLLLFILALFAARIIAYALVDGLHKSLAQDYCQWDCVWYVGIANHGYQLSPNTAPGLTYAQANWAFFPLYPLIIHLTTLILPVSVFTAGLVTANLFLLFFVLTAVLYLPYRRPDTNQAALAAFLLTFPWGVYLSLPYTESLFALLSTAALFSLSANKRSGLTACLSLLISATRVPGILFTPLVAFHAFSPAAIAWRAGDRRAALNCAAEALLPTALAPLGLFLFMGYLHVHTGDALAFEHIEAAWGRRFESPFGTLFYHLLSHDWGRAFGRYVQSNAVSEFSALAGIALCGRLLMLRLCPEFWLLAGTILLALSAGLGSLQRFVLANPVFLIFMFDWLWRSAYFRRYFIPFLISCTALQLCFAHYWLRSYVFLV